MTTATDRLLDDLTESYRSSLLVEQQGGATTITMPHTLRDGTPVTLYVEPHGDQFAVSDRGLVADRLDMQGVDMARATVSDSWTMVRAGIGFPVAIGSNDWELVAVADRSALAIALQSVADSAIRGDALQVLASGYVPQTFSTRVVSRLGSRFAVVPRAPMPGRHGANRVVTCTVGTKHLRYVQALSGGPNKDRRLRSFDHAIALWVGSLVPSEDRVSFLQGRQSDWESWQLTQLADTSQTITENQIDILIEEIERAEVADQHK